MSAGGYVCNCLRVRVCVCVRLLTITKALTQVLYILFCHTLFIFAVTFLSGLFSVNSVQLLQINKIVL